MLTSILMSPWEPRGFSFPLLVLRTQATVQGGSRARQQSSTGLAGIWAVTLLCACPVCKVFSECLLCACCVFLCLGKLLNSGPLKEGPERWRCQRGLGGLGSPSTHSGGGRLFPADGSGLLLTLYASCFHASPGYASPRPHGSPQGTVSQLLLVLDAGLHRLTTTSLPTGLRPFDIFHRRLSVWAQPRSPFTQ